MEARNHEVDVYDTSISEGQEKPDNANQRDGSKLSSSFRTETMRSDMTDASNEDSEVPTPNDIEHFTILVSGKLDTPLPKETGTQKTAPEPAKWQPSFIRLAPLAGIGALLLAACLLVASFAILSASDGVAMSTWPFAPSVYLAIFTGKHTTGGELGEMMHTTSGGLKTSVTIIASLLDALRIVLTINSNLEQSNGLCDDPRDRRNVLA